MFEAFTLVFTSTLIGVVWLLEDVSSADYLAGFARQMPPLDSMIKRLKPNMVKDPFVTDDGNRISEMHVLRCVVHTHLIYCTCVQ